MDLIENLVRYFKQPQKETKGKAPEGTCPVCWGYQQYDHQIREIYKDKQVDVNNHLDSYMMIQKFVVEQIEGIQLKKGKVKECPNCGNQAPSNMPSANNNTRNS